MKQAHTMGALDQAATSPSAANNNNNNSMKSMMLPIKMDNGLQPPTSLPFPQPQTAQTSPFTIGRQTTTTQATSATNIEPATSTNGQSNINANSVHLAQFTQFSDAFAQQQRLLAMRAAAAAHGGLDEFQLQQLRSLPLFHSLPLGQPLAGLLPPPLAGRKREHEEENLKELYGKMQRGKFFGIKTLCVGQFLKRIQRSHTLYKSSQTHPKKV